eukprot:scaffold309421_cov31-Tisochrysis_lutea.AAC.1
MPSDTILPWYHCKAANTRCRLSELHGVLDACPCCYVFVVGRWRAMAISVLTRAMGSSRSSHVTVAIVWRHKRLARSLTAGVRRAPSVLGTPRPK